MEWIFPFPVNFSIRVLLYICLYHRAMDISNKEGDEAALEGRKYIRWDAEGVEKIQPHEEEDIKAVAEQINAIQRAMYNQHRHAFGGKAHARRYRLCGLS